MKGMKMVVIKELFSGLSNPSNCAPAIPQNYGPGYGFVPSPIVPLSSFFYTGDSEWRRRASSFPPDFISTPLTMNTAMEILFKSLLPEMVTALNGRFLIRFDSIEKKKNGDIVLSCRQHCRSVQVTLDVVDSEGKPTESDLRSYLLKLVERYEELNEGVLAISVELVVSERFVVFDVRLVEQWQIAIIDQKGNAL